MKIFNQELTVELLINYAESEKIWLPEFQRSFVWDYNQIRLLIDSLYNNYTISNILIWDGTDELARRRVGGSIKEIQIPKPSNNERIIYLLDGQQRTTTLTLCFTDKPIYVGAKTKKKEIIDLYWDSEYKGDDPELKWVFNDEPIWKLNPSDPDVFIKNMNQKEIFFNYKDRFIKLKHAYNWSALYQTILSEMNNDHYLLMLYNLKISELQKNILYRRVIDIEQKGTLEQVLEVFERINTKNTKLSIYDIMVAKTYRNFSGNFFDLRNFFLLLNYQGSVKQDYFDNIANIDLSKAELLLDESDMLSVIAIMLKKEFKINTVLKLKPEELIDQSKYLHDKFIFLIDFLFKNFNIETKELFKYQPIIKFLSACITYFPKINLIEQEFIQKWFWNTLVFNRYPGAQNERIARDFKHLQNHSSNLNDAIIKMKNDNTRSFHSIELSQPGSPVYFDAYYSAKNQQLYRGLILLLKSRNAKDFYNGIKPSRGSFSNYELEEHHIFPDKSNIGKEIKIKYQNTNNEDIINNIANIALITRETNNNRINKKNPSVYITEFEKEYTHFGKQAEFKTIMLSQFINDSALAALKNDDFETFIYERTKEIFLQVKILCD